MFEGLAKTVIDRRALLGSTGACLASSCSGCPPLRTPGANAKSVLGDSHVHLFNAADLPIVGFLNFVIIPEYLSHVPEVGLALADAAVTVLKAMSPSAQSERRSAPHEATPQEFAGRLADRIDGETGAIGSSVSRLAPTDSVAHSYAVLSTLLRASDPRLSAEQRERSLAPNALRVDRDFLARIAVDGRKAALPGVGVRSALNHSASAIATNTIERSSDDLGAVWDTLKWRYEMVLPRCRHLRDYLSTVASPGWKTDLILNLLVDYDAWLGDGPSAGSSMREQVLFWNDYSAAVAASVEIHTFAGYDPLRHAMERASGGGRSAYWDELSGFAVSAAAGVRPLVAGFKIYPPMGFRVIGNTGTDPKPDRSGLVVSKYWARHGLPIDRFGADLDAALDEFFEFCALRRVPVVAHGRNSQEASTGTGAYASPEFWLRRARWVHERGLPPLRASIAHWDMAQDFRIWLPQILESNLRGTSDIYFDVAYSPAFLDGGDAKGFLQEMGAIYSRADPNARWLMFGSDWIMLGREVGAEGYADKAIAAAASLGWWQEHQEGFFHENLRRFLARPA